MLYNRSPSTANSREVYVCGGCAPRRADSHCMGGADRPTRCAAGALKVLDGFCSLLHPDLSAMHVAFAWSVIVLY